MGSRFLLVMTPRAGTRNHRFLVSEASGLDDADAAAIVNAALRQPQDAAAAAGPDFLAVRNPGVLQADGGRRSVWFCGAGALMDCRVPNLCRLGRMP